MISVIIPLFNKEAHIAKTLESVLTQSFQDFEIIVVDDGSTDDSVDIVKSFSDTRIRIISQDNAGVSAARNRGISEAKGEFIAFLDADDLWLPSYLENHMKLAIEYPGCNVFATSYRICEPSGKSINAIVRNLPFNNDHGVLSNYFKVASSSHPPICSSTIMARTRAFLEIGGFPVGIKSGEDLLTWARLACKFFIAYYKIPLVIINVDGYDVKDKPKRIPPDVDVVGKELLKLKRNFNPRNIDLYISHWHKMRSSIYMRLRQRRKSIKEAAIGLRYHPLNYKLALFIFLNLLPSKFQPF